MDFLLDKSARLNNRDHDLCIHHLCLDMWDYRQFLVDAYLVDKVQSKFLQSFRRLFIDRSSENTVYLFFCSDWPLWMLCLQFLIFTKLQVQI